MYIMQFTSMFIVVAFTKVERMTSLQQLKADVVSGILCKCLDGISDCYVELRVKGVLNITVDFVKQYNLEVDTVCRKDLGVGAGNASNTAAAEDHIGSNSFSSLTSPAVHGQMRTIIGKCHYVETITLQLFTVLVSNFKSIFKSMIVLAPIS